jgi:DNA-binding MarR family transcriptional regulator
MTTRPIVSRAQLDALEATARSEVSRGAGLDPGTDYAWRAHPAGPSITVTVEALQRRGLVRESMETVVVDGRRHRLLVLTAAGAELLAELASRAPAGKEHDADPS